MRAERDPQWVTERLPIEAGSACMGQNESQRRATLEALAGNHGVSLDALRHMQDALKAGGGTMAQFDHPEFGGMGQWFAGGMVMVGRMNDHALKARVSALCDDLAASFPDPRQSTGTTAASRSRASSHEEGSDQWWPDGLGRPATVGAQNATRYAYFPESRRLAVAVGGHVTLYDTRDHVITGASQQQGGTSSFAFTGPNGTVSLDALRRVEAGGDERGADGFEASPSESPQPAHPAAPAPDDAAPLASVAEATLSARAEVDVLAVIERLAELHRKGVLTDAEYSGKKAELLARL